MTGHRWGYSASKEQSWGSHPGLSLPKPVLPFHLPSKVRRAGRLP